MYTVAIVGRPNVGKSALFNRIMGKRIAIVDSAYGLTRDRISANASCQGRHFTLVDTGGIDFDASDNVREMAIRQSQLAISEADTVLFMTDVIEGPVPLDSEIASLLHSAGKHVILVANKTDNESLSIHASTFHKLGFKELFAISAIHGLGIAELMDAIVAHIPDDDKKWEESEIKIAVVGKPNVGKSTYVNRILREERLIVDEQPGTTRDSIDIHISWKGRRITLIDTAGMRHRRNIRESAEYYSFARSRSSIRRCDIALLMIDACDGVSGQDERLARYIADHGKGCILTINKWDLEKEKNISSYRKAVWRKIGFINYVPLIFMSAELGKGIKKSMQAIFYVEGQINRTITTPILNRVLHEIWERNEPPLRHGKRIKFYYAAQIGVKPPSFALFVSNASLIEKSYTNYLVNGLRRAFGFEGTPISLKFKNRRR